MGLFLRKLKFRFRRRKKPKGRHRLSGGQRGMLVLFFLLFILGYGGWRVEKRIGPLAQEAALSVLNSQLLREIDMAVDEVLEEENIKAGSILQEEKDKEGTIENIVTDYAAANRVKNGIAIKVTQMMEKHRTVVAQVPMGAIFSDTLLTGFGVPIPVRAFSTHMIDIQFLDTFDSAGINQTRQQLSIVIKVPIRIAGVFSYRDAEISTEVPLAESVIIGTVPQTYLLTGD